MSPPYARPTPADCHVSGRVGWALAHLLSPCDAWRPRASGCHGRQRASLLTPTPKRHPKRGSHDPPTVFLLTVRVSLLSLRPSVRPKRVSRLSLRSNVPSKTSSRDPKRSSRYSKSLARQPKRLKTGAEHPEPSPGNPAHRIAQCVHPHTDTLPGRAGDPARRRIRPRAPRCRTRVAVARPRSEPSPARPWHHAPIPLL